jgi:hypothetical protein
LTPQAHLSAVLAFCLPDPTLRLWYGLLVMLGVMTADKAVLGDSGKSTVLKVAAPLLSLCDLLTIFITLDNLANETDPQGTIYLRRNRSVSTAGLQQSRPWHAARPGIVTVLPNIRGRS